MSYRACSQEIRRIRLLGRVNELAMKPRRGRPNLAGLEPHRACSIFKRKLDCAIKNSTGNNIKFSVCSLVTATSNKNCQASQGPRFKLQASAFFSFLVKIAFKITHFLLSSVRCRSATVVFSYRTEQCSATADTCNKQHKKQWAGRTVYL